MTNKINFLPKQSWDLNRRIVTFWAEINGKEIRCVIWGETLRDKFNAAFDNPLPAFNENRNRIEEIAEKLINEDRFEADESILIKNDDVPQ